VSDSKVRLSVRNFSIRRAITVGVIFSIPVVLAVLLLASGKVLNISPSIDQTVVPTVPIEQAKRGDYVSFCRPLPLGNISEGSCPDGTVPLVKRVIAIAGDTVLWTPTEVRVDKPDGRYQIHGMRHVHAGQDTVAERFPHPTYGVPAVVMPGSVVVRGDHPLSVDSRYFGSISNTAPGDLVDVIVGIQQ